MLGLRQKLSFGLGGLLLIGLIIGAQSIIHLTLLGESIDIILRENYRSVIACQEMKEALERMDSGTLFILLGEKERGVELIRKNEVVFEKALQVELNNITLVCLSSRGTHSEKLLRYASRLAGRLNRNWYAVYVQTPSEDPIVIDVHTQDIILNTLTLAKQLGALVFTYKGEDIVRTLLLFAKEYRVGHIVIGSPTPRSLWERVRGKTGVVDRLIREAKGVTVTVLDTREEEQPAVYPPAKSEELPVTTEPLVVPVGQVGLSQLISPERIVIWNNPVTKEAVLKTLVEKAEQRKGGGDSAMFLNAVLEREERGSTFFNEGAAFPHARIDGLESSIVSLGLVRQGVSDEPTEKPVELVFLILSPAQNPDEQIKILAQAGKASQSRHLRQHLRSCLTPEASMTAIRDWNLEEEQKTRCSSEDER